MLVNVKIKAQATSEKGCTANKGNLFSLGSSDRDERRRKKCILKVLCSVLWVASILFLAVVG